MKKLERLSDEQFDKWCEEHKQLNDEGICTLEWPCYVCHRQAQLEQDDLTQKENTNEMLNIITEDFVEMVANFYMTDENRKRTYELWKGVKRRIQKLAEG